MFLRMAVLATALFFTGCSSVPTEATHRHPTFTALTFSDGPSMLPTFGLSEMVRIEVCSYYDLNIGDTAVFWHERAQCFVHHRIVGKQGPWFITKGDNNPVPDSGFLTKDNFVGRTHKI